MGLSQKIGENLKLGYTTHGSPVFNEDVNYMKKHSQRMVRDLSDKKSLRWINN